MAKGRKAKKSKRVTTKRKSTQKRSSAAKKSPKKSKRSPGIADQISEALQVVADTMTDVARMRREAKKRTPMDEG